MKKQGRIQKILTAGAVFLAVAVAAWTGLPAVAQAADIWEDDSWNDYWYDDGYIETPYLEKNSLYLAKGGTERALEIQGGIFSSAVSSNEAVAVVTAEGKVLPREAGTTELTIVAADTQGGLHTLTCTVYVTEYKLSKSSVRLSLNQQNQAVIYVQGINYEYGFDGLEVDCSVEDSSVAYAYVNWDNSITVYGLKAGKTKLKVTIDTVVLECNIEVKEISLNKISVQTYGGKKFTLKLKGTKEKVTWSSSSKKVATVSSKGVVTAKERGTSCITAKTEAGELHCYVSVSSKKAIQAMKKAKSVLGATYSQEKRMEKGYYDCSSLIWRSYSPYGVSLGSRYWAPTAADQAKWCTQNKKVIAKKAVSTESLELQPGDLIFYQRDTDNGRYKNIYHVAMFAGYEEYNDWWSSGLAGILVEADGTQVSLRSYIEDYGGGKKIVLIARPT